MARLRLDALDRKIIAELQINSRLSVQDLAERVGLSASPCARRIRILEEAGVITGYAAIIDQTKVGLPISVFVSIKLERQREDELDRFLAGRGALARGRRLLPDDRPARLPAAHRRARPAGL